MPSPIEVPIDVDGAPTRALLYPAGGPAALLLAHGAGAPQTHPFLVAYATGFAERGVTVATFDFLYMAAKRRLPDRAPLLEATYHAAVDQLRNHPLFKDKSLFIGGKSMGGRIASHLAAQGVDQLAGLICLGYPLHPPDKPEKLRIDHLPRITVPTLVVQGERDPFGSPDELAPHLRAVPRSTLHPVPQGDHSFAVPKRGGRPQAEVHAALLDTIAAWIATCSGTP